MKLRIRFAFLLLLVLVLGACSRDQTSVTGEITYLQRITLPDDAVVVVQIRDVSLMDAPAVVIGEIRIQSEGRQVPISYEVSYNSEDIDDRNSYSMFAQIFDGTGKLLFISDTNVPVITRGNPTEDVEIVVVPTG